MGACTLCPRMCGVDRAAGELGACGVPREIYVARAARHDFEEPPISGTRGSGAVFFSGCSLGCIYCQNREISCVSGAPVGQKYDQETLAALFLRLASSGVHNLNLVTPTQYADQIAAALRRVKPRLSVPVVYNTSGYERPETLALFEGLVDIYLPDFKYVSPALADAYSGAPDYPEVARAALAEMYRQVGGICEKDGLLTRGVMVRHLVLPGARRHSADALRALAELLPVEEIYLSLMWQYTPDFVAPGAPELLRRRVTTFEYRSVAAVAEELGFRGFLQGRASAISAYTPRWFS